MSESPYQTIKRSIADGIAAGQWRTGQVLPSEHALCRSFSVSRMTVNRAMRELARENLIRRVPGVGSFVAPPPAQSALLEIRNIATEIAERGNTHHARVLTLAEIEATPEAAREFGCARLYHSRVLHLENGRPLQLEDRLVNPSLAPAYLAQDFTQTTPNEYLSAAAPIERGEHRVQAIIAPPSISALLQLDPGSACLLVIRRTWSGCLASLASLYHPGTRFELFGKTNK